MPARLIATAARNPPAHRVVVLPLARRLNFFSTTTPQLRTMKESEIKRNPHPDFGAVEASRPVWTKDSVFHYTQTAAPGWKAGDGANNNSSSSEQTEKKKKKKHVTIDPYEEGRAPVNNYKLLISAVVPRPIAFMSTKNKSDGGENLAPFSYFQVINHDPPLFVIGFASSVEQAKEVKHTLWNLKETGECTINIISEHFLEAANSSKSSFVFDYLFLVRFSKLTIG